MRCLVNVSKPVNALDQEADITRGRWRPAQPKTKFRLHRTKKPVARHARQERRGDARGVLLRLLQIALGLSAVISAALLAGRTRLPLIFSRDPAVVALVAGIVPLLAVCMVRPGVNFSKHSLGWLAQSITWQLARYCSNSAWALPMPAAW